MSTSEQNNDAIERTREYYDTHGKAGWTEKKTNSFYFENQFSLIAPLWTPGGIVLDIGCAAGIHIPMFLGIGRHVTYHGLDSSKQFLVDAARRYPQLTFIHGSITDEHLLEKAAYNGFWASSVLMHVPYTQWDALGNSIENAMQPGAYGYLSLPVCHPTVTPLPEDTRHLTILSEAEQHSYFRERGWSIIHHGSADGFTTENVWRWYILKLPC